MTRTTLQKSDSIDREVMRSGSRLRLRALALIGGAMEKTGTSKSDLAKALGVGRSAVNQLLKGSGNLTLQTLSDYLGVMGFEVELMVTARGEVSASMRERRRPEVAEVTLRDQDWSRAVMVHPVSESRPKTRAVSPSRANYIRSSVEPTAIRSWGGTDALQPDNLASKNMVSESR